MSTQGPGTYLNLAANGNVLPMTFVKLDPTMGESCLQCGAGDVPIGVSGTWTRYAGGTPANDLEPGGGLEATIGEFPLVASMGCVVPLICGNTGWAPGNRLKPDASGYGIPVTVNTDVAGAIALEPATQGVHGRVLVIVSGTGATLTFASLEAEDETEEADDTALPGQEHEDMIRTKRLMRTEEKEKRFMQDEAARQDQEDQGKHEEKRRIQQDASKKARQERGQPEKEGHLGLGEDPRPRERRETALANQDMPGDEELPGDKPGDKTGATSGLKAGEKKEKNKPGKKDEQERAEEDEDEGQGEDEDMEKDQFGQKRDKSGKPEDKDKGKPTPGKLSTDVTPAPGAKPVVGAPQSGPGAPPPAQQATTHPQQDQGPPRAGPGASGPPGQQGPGKPGQMH